MSWRTAGSLLTLGNEVNAARPRRRKASDGTIGDPAHAARKSDHNPNAAGAVTARDFDEDVDQWVGRAMWTHLLNGRDERVKYVIYEGLLFHGPTYEYANGRPAWTPRRYTGSNQHLTHIHISVSSKPHLYDDRRPWGFGNATQETQMADFFQDLQEDLKALGHDPGPVDGEWGPRTRAAFRRALSEDGPSGGLSPEAVGFYKTMHDDLVARDARPTSFGHVLSWYRQYRLEYPEAPQPGPS